ncbi:MAG: sigma-E processing peptidase SpoIIGA [Clostridia bacterium]|nr:sigma-E processing peptidase SpoIIGA [Clostridia bacterium]
MRVTLTYNGRKIEKDALYDSGNSVFYLGKPVIFGDRQLFCEILNKDFSKTEIMSGAFFDGLCLVPYRSMGKSGLAVGIRLENAETPQKSYYGTVICLYDGDLKNKVILNCIMT